MKNIYFAYSSEKSSKKIIGRIIKLERKKRELTLTELADKLNADKQYIWKLENGKINMSLDYLDKVIEHLKCEHEGFFNNFLNELGNSIK